MSQSKRRDTVGLDQQGGPHEHPAPAEESCILVGGFRRGDLSLGRAYRSMLVLLARTQDTSRDATAAESVGGPAYHLFKGIKSGEPDREI